MNLVIDGYNIAVKITGTGEETIVMLQGWGTSLGMYDSIAGLLNTKYTFVQFDFPGFGESDEPREPWAVDGYCDFFCRLMEALEIKKATLIGHSYGGRVMIKLAARESLPFEIDRLVFVDGAGIMSKKTLLQKWKVKRYKLCKKVLEIKWIHGLFPEVIDHWKGRQGSADYRNATPIMRQCLVKAVNEDLSPLLPLIKQETLLIWGDLDTATPLAHGQLMEAKIPKAGLCVLKGAGHFSYLEKPQEFAGIIKSYFHIGE